MKKTIFLLFFSTLSYAQQPAVHVKILSCQFVNAQPKALTTVSLPISTGDYVVKATDKVTYHGELMTVESAHVAMGIEFLISCEAKKIIGANQK